MRVAIPPELREWLKLLAKQKTFMGWTEERVAIEIIRKGVIDMIQTGYIKNLLEQRDLLKGKK